MIILSILKVLLRGFENSVGFTYKKKINTNSKRKIKLKLIKFQKIKGLDIDLTRKESRTPFILIILFYWLLGLILGWALTGPKLILALLLIGIILNIIVLIINFYWKISNHSLVLTAVILFTSQLFNNNYLWLLLILPIVGWSRWVQKKHTWGQLIGGVGLAVFAWWLLQLFGY